MLGYIPRRFNIIRDKNLCVNCGICVKQCANECPFYYEDGKNVL